jgi:hypothetical protein
MRPYDGLSNHPLGEFEEKHETQAFRRARRVRCGKTEVFGLIFFAASTL